MKIRRLLPYIAFLIIMMFKVKLFNLDTNVMYLNLPWYETPFLITLGSLLVMSCWILLIDSEVKRLLCYLFVDAVLSFVILADLIYYRYFGDLITIPVLMQVSQLHSLGGSITTLFHYYDILLFADLIALAIFITGIIVRRNVNKQDHSHKLISETAIPPNEKRKYRVIAGLIALGIGFSLVFFPLHTSYKEWAKELLTRNWYNTSIYNTMGLFAFHGYDFYNFVSENVVQKQSLTDKEAANINQWFQAQGNQLLSKNTLEGAAKGSNVLVIQAEAIQNFVIGLSFNGVEITPNLNALLKDSLYFDNYYHQTGQGRTSDADFTSHCSLHPLPTGSVFIRYPNHAYDCLPGTLRDNGYDTAAFHAYEPSFWNRYNVYPNIGFSRFYSAKDFGQGEQVGWGLGDESLFDQSIDKMKLMKKPFYSYIVTLSSHYPFTMPDKYNTLQLGPVTGLLRDYIQSVHYVDYAVGKMVEKLKAEGLWDNTLIAFYGDHDDSIDDPKGMAALLGKTLSPMELDVIKNQVPLFIHMPGNQGAGVYKQAAGQIDLTPTILNLLGISTKGKYMMGDDMLAGDSFIALRNGSFTDGKVYYSASIDHVLANGVCYQSSDGTKLPAQSCSAGFDRAQQELDISDTLILSDGIKKLRKQP